MSNNARRTFLKASFLSSVVVVIGAYDVFDKIKPSPTLNLVQKDLFPFTQELDVKMPQYMSIILAHSRISERDKEFILNGVKWLNEEAVLKYEKLYTKLSSFERQNVLKIISKENWGESWISSLLTYTMEAIFSDKIYGVNPQESAHKWLAFDMGLPRPTKALL